jgi:DNA helicase-2/ATP-dependent DNA helicase PcrA
MAHGTEHDLLTDLTPAQRDAVTHFEGPLLILAAAGSGKTRVITRRMAYLVHQGVRPQEILAVTFTNKAAGEMRNRIWQLLPDSHKVDSAGIELPPHRFLRVSTYHSFGAYFLRRYADRLNLGRNFTIYDQQDRNRLIKESLAAANVDNIRFTPERIEGAISKAKNQLLTPERYAGQAVDFFAQTVARVYPVYERRLRDSNAIDFDDLLLLPALALKQDAELRAQLDARFRFILVDEYQDTNLAQYAIVRALSIDCPNLCVVGDPDQSIYRWRGSDLRNILDFERDFPTARVIHLDRNYRSTKSILRAAGHLITFNRHRKPKDLLTDNPTGKPVSVATFETGDDEAEGIAGQIQEAVASGDRRFGDFAVFLRVNALSRALEAAFVKNRVPYQMVRGLAFFERKENRDVLAYLRLLLNPQDDLAFVRAVNEPARGIGKTSLEHLRSYAEPRGLSLSEASRQVERIPAIKGKAAAGLREFSGLVYELGKLAESPPDAVIEQVLNQSGYRNMLADSTDPEDQDRLANTEELITAARQYALEDSSRTLADFLENITLASDVDSWDNQQDHVSIMTLHAAKGLEFPVVFMPAMEQGLLPHERSLEHEDELEEERRLAFVGMTRAKEELTLSHSRRREFRGRSFYAIESMFLNELPEGGVARADRSPSHVSRAQAINEWRTGSRESAPGWADAGIDLAALEKSQSEADDAKHGFSEGMFVEHESYGGGRITEVSGYGALRKVKVRFSTAGERTFLANKAKLAIVQRK